MAIIDYGDYFGGIQQADDFRPMLNVGCLFDIQTGTYVKGVKGENILNGGIAATDAIVGPGNSNKSTIMIFRLLMAFYRYVHASGGLYDTENSATLIRYMNIADQIDPTGMLSETLLEETRRFKFTNAEKYNGTEWFTALKKGLYARAAAVGKLDTPMLDKHGRVIKAYPPYLSFLDSLSMFFTELGEEKSQGADVGSSEMNPVAMQLAGGKSQMFDSMPTLTGRTGLYMMMTAHMGDQIIMGQFDTPKKKLAFLSNKRKIKKVPENFNFLTGNLYEITDLTTLMNKDKTVEFPLHRDDDLKGNTDLMKATILPIRTKSGATGIPFDILISQTNGVQPTLTEYYYSRGYGRFGLSSNQVTQFIDLMPDVKFSKGSIRQLIKENTRWSRAMQITSDLCQINNLWPEYAQENMVEPGDLYEGLIKKGYDWNRLLDSRPYWTFDQYEHEVPFLSTKDLLEMYHGTYEPYWYK